MVAIKGMGTLVVGGFMTIFHFLCLVDASDGMITRYTHEFIKDILFKCDVYTYREYRYLIRENHRIFVTEGYI